VAVLWEQLQRVRTIHARGTPTSGKSILGRLLKEYVQREWPHMQVYLFNWPASVEPQFGYRNYYYLLNYVTGEPETTEDTWLGRPNTLIMVDEAQRSYESLNFWDEFVKPLTNDRGPLLLLLSAYGCKL
jgi:hypothetical protein